MRVADQSPDGKVFMIEMTSAEAQLLGCLEDAWNNATTDGPPGQFWYQNVDISPALRAVAAFTELLARSNGLRLALDSLDEMLRDPMGDGLPRLPGELLTQDDIEEAHVLKQRGKDDDSATN